MAGGPDLNDLDQARKVGAPGLAFETWDGFKLDDSIYKILYRQ